MAKTSSAKSTIRLSEAAEVIICRTCGAVLYVEDQTRRGYLSCGLCGNKWKLEVMESND